MVAILLRSQCVNSMTINQHWFRKWLRAPNKQQVVTLINVGIDLQCPMVSLGYNKLMSCIGYRGVAEVDKCRALSSAVITGSYSHHIALCGNYRAYSRQRALTQGSTSPQGKKVKTLYDTVMFSIMIANDQPPAWKNKISPWHKHFLKKILTTYIPISHSSAWIKCEVYFYNAVIYFHTSHGQSFNSYPPWQNGRHFTDSIFRCIFVNDKFCIFIKISLKFVPKGPVDNNPVLV